MAEQKARHVIPKKHLYRAAFNWETWVQCCYNYERMMGMACGHTFVPVIDDLYKDDPDGAAKRKEVMEREMEFFNVHIEFGSCILGMAIALEEQKSLGEPIPGEFITSLKTSLMGPLAGIGDTIYQGVLIPILLAICIDITLTGTVWGGNRISDSDACHQLYLQLRKLLLRLPAGLRGYHGFSGKGSARQAAAGSTGHGLYGYGWPDCQLCKSFLWSGACHIGVKIQCADAAV